MIDVREVAPRDGLQAEKPVDINQRVELIHKLLGAGVTHIEIASFMRDDVVPSMFGAEQVAAGVPPISGVIRTGLVANTKGALRALQSGLEEVTITVSLSEKYSQLNTGMSRGMALQNVGEIVGCIESQAQIDAVVSFAFGSPYRDVSLRDDLPKFVDQLQNLGCDRITLADTTGEATPRLIREALKLVGCDVGLHLHDSRGTGLVNALAGLESGVRRFDSSIGGIGGSPFADFAAGNVATETLVFLLHDLGYETSIDLEKFLALTPFIERLVGHELPSALAQNYLKKSNK